MGIVEAGIEDIEVFDYGFAISFEDEFYLRAIRNSLKTFGQISPIIVRDRSSGKFSIIDGVIRFRIMKELNFDRVIILNCGQLSDKEAMLYRIVLNSSKCPLHIVGFCSGIKKVLGTSTSYNILEFLPYTRREMSGLFSFFEYDWEKLLKSEENNYQKLDIFDLDEENL